MTNASFASRIGAYFGLDDPFTRPRPAVGRSDLAIATGWTLLSLAVLELLRGVGALEDVTQAPWLQMIAVASLGPLLLGRRRWPLIVAVLAGMHLFVMGAVMPVIMTQTTIQISYFITVFSAVAWASDRRGMVVVVGAIVLFMFAWIAWQLAVGSGLQQILDETRGVERPGLLPPVTSAILISVLVNAVFFGAAIIGGQVAWRNARRRTLMAEQAETIRAQSEDLQRRAVIDERLRIARELHDVVAHHVSAIGVQASAGRRMLDQDPGATANALQAIESTAREAVTSMRGLLGALRVGEHEAGADGRAPDPGLGDLQALVDSRNGHGFTATLDVVQDRPGALDEVPAPMALSIYRTIEEALTNTLRHSTARTASVVVRVDGDGNGTRRVEAEINDDGRPRSGTSGSGLGQLGIRERTALHRGEADIGPRLAGGYRVRVRFPFALESP
ncbi:MAG: histidine kinase [Thermoleophilia bacterium]